MDVGPGRSVDCSLKFEHLNNEVLQLTLQDYNNFVGKVGKILALCANIRKRSTDLRLLAL